METGRLFGSSGDGRTGTRQEKIEHVREFLRTDPAYSIRNAPCIVSLSALTVHRILRNSLIFYPYKLQYLQFILEDDEEKRWELAEHCLSQPDG